MKISILLTTYDREDDCIICLTELLKQKTKEVEIILLDDLHFNSQKLIDFCALNDIKYIHSGSQKQGQPMWRVPGFALNIGAKQSSGDYLILGNAEIYQISSYTVQKLAETNLLAFPRVWDQPQNSLVENYKSFPICSELPFFMGVPRESFFRAGGYDEDFVGYAWEDTDLVERLKKSVDKVKVDADVVHLWNPRGQKSRKYATNLKASDTTLNKSLYLTRKDILVRNEGRDWGVL